jgi:hypothetical protein
VSRVWNLAGGDGDYCITLKPDRELHSSATAMAVCMDAGTSSEQWCLLNNQDGVAGGMH